MAISPTGAGTEDNSALVEKMMMNLRRASQNFGKVEQGKSLAEQPGGGRRARLKVSLEQRDKLELITE